MTVVLCFAGCILLIPSDVEEFDHVDPQEMASEVLGVKQDEVCVWQQVTKKWSEYVSSSTEIICINNYHAAVIFNLNKKNESH